MKRLFKSRPQPSNSNLNDIADKLTQVINTKFSHQNEMLSQIVDLVAKMEVKISNLEDELVTKKINDKQNLGHITYKIAELEQDFFKKDK